MALGAGTGLLAGSLGYLALIAPITGFGVVATPRGSGPSAISGLCVGFGIVFAGLLVGAQARCDPASCSAPDLAPFFLVAAGAVAAGVLIGIRALAHR